MIILAIIIILSIYYFLLFRNVTRISKTKIIALIIALSLLGYMFFSMSYTPENINEYKNLHSKNLIIRDNIRTIKKNIPLLERKLNDNPNDFNGWLMLGKSYSILQKYSMASQAYQVALKINPNNLDVIKEFILVLRSDDEELNKNLITRYYNIYLSKKNEPSMLLDKLNFSVSVNDNLLAIETLKELIAHKDINNKKQYLSALSELEKNSSDSSGFLNLRINSNKQQNGFFFILLREPDVNKPFAVKRIRSDKKNFNITFSERDFMLSSTDVIPDRYMIVIKYSKDITFTQDSKPVEIFSQMIKQSKDESESKVIEINL